MISLQLSYFEEFTKILYQIKCYHYEIFRIYAEFTQDSKQMFITVLFYIFLRINYD